MRQSRCFSGEKIQSFRCNANDALKIHISLGSQGMADEIDTDVRDGMTVDWGDSFNFVLQFDARCRCSGHTCSQYRIHCSSYDGAASVKTMLDRRAWSRMYVRRIASAWVIIAAGRRTGIDQGQFSLHHVHHFNLAAFSPGPPHVVSR
jgi:hypothetical protein